MDNTWKPIIRYLGDLREGLSILSAAIFGKTSPFLLIFPLFFIIWRCYDKAKRKEALRSEYQG